MAEIFARNLSLFKLFYTTSCFLCQNTLQLVNILSCFEGQIRSCRVIVIEVIPKLNAVLPLTDTIQNTVWCGSRLIK